MKAILFAAAVSVLYAGDTQVKAVYVDGREISAKLGKYDESFANTWASVGNTNSKIRITNKNPVIKIDSQIWPVGLTVVKLSKEDSYRYIYINKSKNKSSISSFPSEPSAIIGFNIKLSQGKLTNIIELTSPLACGEYAVWINYDSSIVNKSDYKTKQEYNDALNQVAAGVFWSFGVDDAD